MHRVGFSLVLCHAAGRAPTCGVRLPGVRGRSLTRYLINTNIGGNAVKPPQSVSLFDWLAVRLDEDLSPRQSNHSGAPAVLSRDRRTRFHVVEFHNRPVKWSAPHSQGWRIEVQGQDSSGFYGPS